ncbi:MAG: hypothetical protein KF901_05540 [Myxococcales bacterium]|nr:hypothetical protein [Myxococcales bacterium]
MDDKPMPPMSRLDRLAARASARVRPLALRSDAREPRTSALAPRSSARLPRLTALAPRSSARALWLAALLAASTSPVLAQDDEPTETFDESDPGDSGEDIDVSDWALPRVLVVVGPRLHQAVASQVNDVLRGVAEIVDGRSYVRRAQREGLRPTSDTAYEQLLAEEDVALVIELQPGRLRFIPTVRTIYREGRNGFVLLEEQHPLSGLRLLGAERRRIADEVRLALAVTTRPSGGPPGPGESSLPRELRRPADEERPRDEATPGRVIEVELAVGGGIGTRSFSLPTQAGQLRLGTTPFPAARLDAGLHIRPSAASRLRAGFSLSYSTSVGLRTTDYRIDGSERETASRSQRLDAAVELDVRLGRERGSAALAVALGWSLRRFSSEAPVTLPDFGLGGPRLALGVVVPLFDGRLRVGLVPDLQLLVRVSDPLQAEGIRTPGVAVGGEATVAVALTDAFLVRLAYRESHALLSSERAEGSRDIERYLALQLVYAP